MAQVQLHELNKTTPGFLLLDLGEDLTVRVTRKNKLTIYKKRSTKSLTLPLGAWCSLVNAIEAVNSAIVALNGDVFSGPQEGYPELRNTPEENGFTTRSIDEVSLDDSV